MTFPIVIEHILPCPFCGRRESALNLGFIQCGRPEDLGYALVRCPKEQGGCGAEMKVTGCESKQVLLDEAIRRWNQRAEK